MRLELFSSYAKRVCLSLLANVNNWELQIWNVRQTRTFCWKQSSLPHIAIHLKMNRSDCLYGYFRLQCKSIFLHVWWKPDLFDWPFPLHFTSDHIWPIVHSSDSGLWKWKVPGLIRQSFFSTQTSHRGWQMDYGIWVSVVEMLYDWRGRARHSLAGIPVWHELNQSPPPLGITL